jgi:hypothetical protein
MAYVVLADLKVYLGIPVGVTTDDVLLAKLILGVKGLIDDATCRTFEAVSATRKFDAPMDGRREIKMDIDLLTVTTLTNGDGTVIASTEYILLPNNYTPKHTIKLRDFSSVMWLPSYAAPMGWEQAISVAGTWGYTATDRKSVV